MGGVWAQACKFLKSHDFGKAAGVLIGLPYFNICRVSTTKKSVGTTRSMNTLCLGIQDTRSMNTLRHQVPWVLRNSGQIQAGKLSQSEWAQGRWCESTEVTGEVCVTCVAVVMVGC